MDKKRHFIFIFITFLFLQSCKEKENSIALESNFIVDQDSIDQIIKPEFLEKENDNINELYAAFDKKIIWNDDKNRKTLINFIKKCDEDGLFPEDYHAKEIDSLEKKQK